MSEANAELTELFRDEATQRLNQMDAALLAVESGEQDAESVGALFRHAHTIKGAASMLGFDDIAALAHAAEDVLAVVRDSGAFPPDLAALLLRVTGALRAMLGGAAEPIDELMADLAATRATLSDGQAAGEAPAPDAPEVPVRQPRAPHELGTPQGLRVPAEKLDHLLNVTAEIMEYRSRLTHELGKERLLS